MNAKPQHRVHHIDDIRRITWIGLVSNVFIAVLKFVVGIIGASQAVVADAVHSLSDMTTDIGVLLGVRYWSTPADEDHPYGHGRIETMVTTALGVALAGVALAIGYNAIATVREAHIRQPGWIALIGAIASIVVKEILYRWTLAVGKDAKSTAVMANAWHHRSDALSSIPAALAVIVALINSDWSFVDHIGALIVSLIILHASWRIIKPALGELADRGEPEHIRRRIEALVMALEGVEAVHAVRTRRVGPGIHVDLHITVDGDMSVYKGHDISETVKKQLLDNGPDVIDVVVHLEPCGYETKEQGSPSDSERKR
jgi:cation diffusion facilitator family transporter